MSQKSSVPQAVSFVSQPLKRDICLSHNQWMYQPSRDNLSSKLEQAWGQSSIVGD